MTHRLENKNTKVVLALLLKFLKDKRTGNPQGTLPWGPAGFDFSTSRGLGETDSSLEEHKKMLCTPRYRGDPIGHWTKTASAGEPPVEMCGGRSSPGMGALDGRLGVNPLGAPLILPQSLQAPGLGCLRPNYYKRGSATSAVSGNCITALLSKVLPTRARPSFSITSPSHQEADTSVWASSIKRQTAEAAVSQWPKQKPN